LTLPNYFESRLKKKYKEINEISVFMKFYLQIHFDKIIIFIDLFLNLLYFRPKLLYNLKYLMPII